VKLDQAFDVAAPLDEVWQALIDVERVAPCLPGAAVTGRNDDGSYAGSFSVKIGPTTASYTGKLVMETVDDQAHTATMLANGTDKRGQGGAKATIVSTASSAGDGGTHVEVSTDYHITGRLARFGRGGMIEDISERLLREFAERLQASLVAPVDQSPPAAADAEPAAATEPEAGGGAPTPPANVADEPSLAPPPAEPLQAGSLVGPVLLDRLRRNPLPAVAVLVLVLRLLRRRRRRKSGS
jgi:carbon monoxide dehydrogenase subunit G